MKRICLNFFAILLYIKLCNCEALDKILIGPPDEDFPGVWGPWEYCAPGTYVVGFRVKSENSRFIHSNEGTQEDSFGLSGVKLICGIVGNLTYSQVISSNVAAEGEWSDLLYCDGYVVGFEVKTQRNKKGRDDIGVTNMRLLCTARNHELEHELDYEPGIWSDPFFCLRNQGVCGVRTKTKIPFDDDDLVGISSVRLKCCDFVSQSSTCLPTDGFELLFEFDNTMGLQNVTYSYILTVGVSRTQSSEKEKIKEGQGTGTLELEYQSGNGNDTRQIQGRRKRSIRNFPRFGIHRSGIKNFKQSPLPALPSNPNIPNLFPIRRVSQLTGPLTQYFPPRLPAGYVNLFAGNPIGYLNNDEKGSTNSLLEVFTLNAGGTLKTGYKWGSSSSLTWKPSRTTEVQVTIRVGHAVSLYQVVGVCGDFIVRPEKIFQNGTTRQINRKLEVEKDSFGMFIHVANFVSGISSIFNDFIKVMKRMSETINLFNA